MMLDRMEGNAELKTSVHPMLASRRLTHSVLLVGEEGLGAGFAARCIAADYLYPAGGAPAEALLRGECCRAVGKAGKRDSGQIETGIVREAISVEGMGAGGRYLVSQVTAMRSEIFNTSLSAEGRAVLLYHVERMNEESANALLKVMEEPPEGVLFLLTADSLAGVLPTIRSRCVSFAIAPVSPADCARYCTAHGVDKKTAALYSELFDGHIGTVLACLLTGVTASTYCLSLSLLLAFAMLYPEVQLLLFFVIPIRVKYFGFFAAALWVFSFLSAPLAGKLSYLLSMLNVWAFFGPMAYRSVRAWIRREQWKRKNRR